MRSGITVMQTLCLGDIDLMHMHKLAFNHHSLEQKVIAVCIHSIPLWGEASGFHYRPSHIQESPGLGIHWGLASHIRATILSRLRLIKVHKDTEKQHNTAFSHAFIACQAIWVRLLSVMCCNCKSTSEQGLLDLLT